MKMNSGCPQYLTLDVIGDKWTMLIIRDMMIGGKKYFREFLHSKEGIASNILSNRLKTMENEGLIYKSPDPTHRQKLIYRLTLKGIDLFPILLENARWALKYKEVDSRDAVQARQLLEDLSKGVLNTMDLMKKEHLNAVDPNSTAINP